MINLYLASFVFLFAHNSSARISPLPNDYMPLIMTCIDLTSGEPVVEVYERGDGSKAWIGFIMDDGSPGLLSVVRTDDGFRTKKGEFNNLSLSRKDEATYQFSLYAANLDGSDGEPVIAPIDVTCSAASN